MSTIHARFFDEDLKEYFLLCGHPDNLIHNERYDAQQSMYLDLFEKYVNGSYPREGSPTPCQGCLDSREYIFHLLTSTEL